MPQMKVDAQGAMVSVYPDPNLPVVHLHVDRQTHLELSVDESTALIGLLIAARDSVKDF